MKDLDVNTTIWCVFMSVTLQADEIIWWIYDPSRIDLGNLWNNYSWQLRSWSKSRRRSPDCPRLTGTSQFGESSLLCDRAIRVLNSQTCVFSDSVLHLGGISPEPVQSWNDNEMVFGKSQPQRCGSNRPGADGVRVDDLSRIRYIVNSQWDSEYDGRIAMWTWAISRKDHLHVHVQRICMGELQEMKTIVWRIPWMPLHVPRSKPNGEWNKTADVMMLHFAESPIFQSTSSGRGELKSKGGGKKSIHFNGSEETAGNFGQSAQYLRSCRRFMQRIRSRFKKS